MSRDFAQRNETSLESEPIRDINILTSGQTKPPLIVYGKTKPMTFRCVCALMLALAGVMPASADVTFSLTIWREACPAYQAGYGQTRFYAQPFLSDSTPPLSHHRVEAPGDICSADFGTNTGHSAQLFNNAGEMLNALTNGIWKLWLNRDTPQEELYTFTLDTSDITTNSLTAVSITTPRNGGINVASNTAYTWIGPPEFDDITVWVRGGITNTIAALETNWPAGPLLDPGTNFFAVTYNRDVTTNYSISTPTNDVLGLLTNWAAPVIQLKSKAESGFLTEGLPPSALGLALDAPGLVWETSGAAEWLAQSTNATDGVDAAQSGPIQDGESTTLRTVIYGTNTISFAWRSDCEGWADYVEFSDNGSYIDDLTGIIGWEQFTYHLSDGVVHVLEWTYNKDASDVEGADAAFLDQVRLGPDTLPLGPPVQLNLTIAREQKSVQSPIAPGQLLFSVLPSLTTTQAPLSYHEVISPIGWFSATYGPTNTAVATTSFTDFGELQNKLTNGLWTLWLDRTTPQAQYFTFTVSAPTMFSNDFAPVFTISPPDDASSISPYTRYEWTGGWEASDELFVSANTLSNDVPFTYATELLTPTTATNWSNGPVWNEGTNNFLVRYARIATTNFSVSTPFLGWQLGLARYESSATASFTVSNAFSAQLLNAQQSGGQFQFEFFAPLGFTNLVQSRTNLTLGDWIDRTNILGDGNLKVISLPIGPEPAEFFRVITE